MEQIIYEFNGIKYLLVERQVTDSTKDKINKVAEKHNCIFQGIKEIKQSGFLSQGFAVIKILVPESQIFDFNKSL